MKRFAYHILLVLAVVSTLTGCDDYDTWTTSTDALLTFSEDTVSFDTIISEQSSTTKTLVACNRGDKGLRISKIELRDGQNSPFRVNVDGQYLYDGAGTDFEVRRKDSIYIRAEVKLPKGEDNAVHHYEDILNFTLESGITQKVVLVADGMDVYIMRGQVFDKDTTICADRPIVVYDSLVVGDSANLTIAPGTTLMFHNGVSLDVHGKLTAVGTQDQPITLRGDRVDNLFDYLPYDNTPNRWGGIHFYGTSLGNRIEQCDIHSGDYGIICDSTLTYDETDTTLVMTNSILHNVGGPGLQLTMCRTRFVGCQISNTLGKSVNILGGCHEFVHCTIAQFYPWDADRGDALYLANQTDLQYYYPLDKAHFLNCVITGYADDVIMGNILEGTDVACNYLFANCLLRTPKVSDDDRYVNITWDNDDLEKQGKDHFVLFDTDNFLYDFAPDSLSAIRGMGDIQYTKDFGCETDMRGNSRVDDGAPDAGCYEFLEKKE